MKPVQSDDALKASEPVAWIDAGDLRGIMQGNSAWAHPEDQGRMIPLFTTPQPASEDVESAYMRGRIDGINSYKEVNEVFQDDKDARDAARYRWLREHQDHEFGRYLGSKYKTVRFLCKPIGCTEYELYNSLDEAIDEAMKGTKE